MRKTPWLFLSAITLAVGVLTVACGGDDDNTVTAVDGGGPDGTVVINPPPDSGPVNPTDAGDAGCTFAGFVTNLVNTSTNPTASPSLDLGDNCSPSLSQDDFKPLFP